MLQRPPDKAAISFEPSYDHMVYPMALSGHTLRGGVAAERVVPSSLHPDFHATLGRSPHDRGHVPSRRWRYQHDCRQVEDHLGHSNKTAAHFCISPPPRSRLYVERCAAVTRDGRRRRRPRRGRGEALAIYRDERCRPLRSRRGPRRPRYARGLRAAGRLNVMLTAASGGRSLPPPAPSGQIRTMLAVTSAPSPSFGCLLYFFNHRWMIQC